MPICVRDPRNPNVPVEIQVGDRIACTSMPSRPLRVTGIVDNADAPLVAGTFARGGAVMLDKRKLATAWLVSRAAKVLPIVGEPGQSCTWEVFKHWYESNGGPPKEFEQSWASKRAGFTLMTPAYAQACQNAGVPYPFATAQEQAARDASAYEMTEEDLQAEADMHEAMDEALAAAQSDAA